MGSATKGLFTVLLVIFILGPLGQLLRTQQPFTCFQTTYDENVFLQAIHNYEIGRGFRQHEDLKPYDAKITVGPYLAWGTVEIKKRTGLDLPQAGRLWIYLHFFGILFLIFGIARKESGTFAGGLVAVALFGYFVTQIPAASYLVYGVLGEMPGWFLAIWAGIHLDRGNRFRSAFLAVLAVFTKPTLAFWIPALVLANHFQKATKHRHTIRFSAYFAILGACLAVWISHQRGESVSEWFRAALSVTHGIALHGRNATFFSLFGEGASLSFKLLSCLCLISSLGLRTRRPSLRAMGLFFLIGVAFYLMTNTRPLDKHWAVFMIAGSALLAIRLSHWLGTAFEFVFKDENTLRMATLGVLAAWILNVPGINRRHFVQSRDTQCAVKEQRAVGSALLNVWKSQQYLESDFISVMEGSASKFIFELPFNPTEYRAWPQNGDHANFAPKYVYGDRPTLEAGLPSSCKAIFLGDLYAAYKCQ